jgi:DNA (cytosine-5)-methyltransferase 1
LSQAGLSKGMAKGSGTRSGLLWEIERILDECEELPQILLMENVPQVIGEKNRDAFRDWFLKLESLGYKSWYTIMNGKDYEIPQNRERCFMVSALGDCYYDFPEKTGCKLRLKDLLEKDVGQEYYLSDSLIEYFERHTVESKEKGNGFKFEPTNGDCIDSARRVYSADQAAPTLTTCGGGNQEVKIAVPSAVSCGYEYAESGDSINLSYPNSKSRRGRVGHQVAQTLLTQNEIAVVEPLEPKVLGGIGEKKSNGGTQWYQQDRIYDDNVAISVTTAFNPYYKVEQEEIRVFDAYNKREIGGDAVGTICTNAGARQAGVFWVKKPNARVRKLTERECFRLMGVKDEDFDRVSKNQSKSSLYHLAGDSIITNCLMAIFKEML